MGIQIPETSEYIIAYLDFLGSTERIKNDEIKSLEIIVDIYKAAVEFIDNSKEGLEVLKSRLSNTNTKSSLADVNYILNHPLNVKIFSDNIIIAARLTDSFNINQYYFERIIAFSSAIQGFALWMHNWLLAGGITIGNLAINDTLVWGTGLLKATELENTKPHYPRIIVDRTVVDMYQILFERDDSYLSIHPIFQQTESGGNYYLMYEDLWVSKVEFDDWNGREHIPSLFQFGINKLLKNRYDEKTKEKIKWVYTYHNELCHRRNYPDYIVSPERYSEFY